MLKSERPQVIERAKEIIRTQPAAGRRVIAKELRSEFGEALRDAVILRLQREIYPYPKQHIEAKRAVRLKGEGFLPFEVKEIKKQVFKNTIFMEVERKARSKDYKEFINDLKSRGFTKREINSQWRDKVIDKYQDEGWLLSDGELDPWQMFRDIRAAGIKSGKWKETPRYLKSHRKDKNKLDKGKVKEQRARFREKLRKSRN